MSVLTAHRVSSSGPRVSNGLGSLRTGTETLEGRCTYVQSLVGFFLARTEQIITALAQRLRHVFLLLALLGYINTRNSLWKLSYEPVGLGTGV